MLDKGDLYLKHIRGSRYGYNCDKIFYKYPGGARKYCSPDMEDLMKDLIEVKQATSGRFILNEKREITIYREEDGHWSPYYVRTLEEDIVFDDINNDPKGLKPGLLWTGFASHHGSRFQVDMKGRVFFNETCGEPGVITKKKWWVKSFSQDLAERVLDIKQQPGSFRINEYGHIWAPVAHAVLTEHLDENVVSLEEIKRHFSEMTSVQKNTIKKYSSWMGEQKENVYKRWYPVYCGKYSKPIEIGRKDEPHIILSEEEIFPEFTDD